MGSLLALLEPLRVLLEHLWGFLGRPPGDLLGGLLGPLHVYIFERFEYIARSLIEVHNQYKKRTATLS